MTNPGFLVDATALAKMARLDAASRNLPPRADPLRRSHNDEFRVVVRNSTEDDLPRFSVLGIDGPIYDPLTERTRVEDEVQIKGVTPTAAHAGRFLITQGAIAADDWGEAAAVGLTFALLHDPEGGPTGRYANVRDGETKSLKRAPGPVGSSAPIVWENTELDDDDLRLVLVHLNPQPIGGATGGGTVVFTIDSYDYATGIALCNVEYRQYGVTTLYGESEYGIIEVIDPAGCYFNEAEIDLLGRWGTASYMQPVTAIDPYQPGVWVVIGLCCPGA